MMLNSTASSQPTSEATDLIFRALRKRWLIGTLVATSVLLVALFYTIGNKKIFRASATVQIDPNPPRPLGNAVQSVVDMGAGSYWNNREYFNTQLTILKGHALAEETAKLLNLHRDAAFIANLPDGAPVSNSNVAISVADGGSILMGRITLEPVKDSRLVVVHLEDANPQRARRILSAHLEGYLTRNVDLAVASTGAASEWLRGQTETLKSELERSELALHDYKKDKRILSVSLGDQSNMLRGEMQQLNEALTKVQTRKEELASRVRELDKVDPNDPTTLPTSELLGSTILANLRKDYAEAKGACESLLGAGKGDKHPEVAAAQARKEATRQALMSEVRNVQGALRGDLAAVIQEAKGLSGLFEHAKQRALDLNMLEIEYRRLERAKDNTEKLFGLVLERSKESDLTGMMRFNNISIVEKPMAGGTPVRPKVPLNIAIGLFLGLALGVAAAVGREWMDRTLRVPDDVEDVVGVPLLGMLPALSGKAASSAYYSSYRRHGASRQRRLADGSDPGSAPPELIAHALPASNAAECARGIRTSLTLAAPDKPYKCILVTSGSPSEGKTTVASTIAVAFAQAGQRVLLLDCDLRRARLHRVFKQRNVVGISSLLQNPATIDEAILPTGVPNLSLLAAGPHVPNPAELLQSESFAALLGSLRDRFDRLVIDSPPVLVVTDAAVLAAQADTTVLVVRARKTKREVARRVVRKLSDLGVTVAGVVLNALEEPKRRGGYYYGYYTKDTYGAGDESAASS